MNVGDRFGQWVVVDIPADVRARSNILCRCSCGVERTVRADHLSGGRSTQCKACAMRVRRRGTREPLPEWWESLVARFYAAYRRCTFSEDAQYKDYGGRGIEFRFISPVSAARWAVENIGPPLAGLTLDRIDNDRHYEAGNLRWASRSEQALNRRISKRVWSKPFFKIVEGSA